jgi:hypothetical protein
MDLTTRIIKNCLMINFLIGIALLISCSSKNNEKCSKFEEEIKTFSLNQKSEFKLSLFQLNVECDSLYIFEGPRLPDEISEVIHLPFNETLNDDDRLFIFTKNGSMILNETSFCGDVGVHNLINSKGYTVLKSDTKLIVKKKEVSNKPYFEVFLEK